MLISRDASRFSGLFPANRFGKGDPGWASLNDAGDRVRGAKYEKRLSTLRATPRQRANNLSVLLANNRRPALRLKLKLVV